MAQSRRSPSRQPRRRYHPALVVAPRASSGLDELVRDGDGLLVFGLDALGDDTWAPLAAAGLRLLRVAEVGAAVELVAGGAAQLVITDTSRGPHLIDAVRARPELAGVHVVVCADLDSPDELRDALDSGADDVMRIPFEPQVLAVRVATGLRAARLRASEALLRSLVDNIPGALYRCACDGDWTREWLSDEIEDISGYAAAEFIDNAVRTFASIEHPDDHDYVARSVMESVDTGRPFALEYRIMRRDGSVRWVLERGQAQESGDGRWWLDGAIFDITARPRGGAGPAGARGRAGPARRGARLAHPDRGRRRPRAARHRAQPPRRRAAAARLRGTGHEPVAGAAPRPARGLPGALRAALGDLQAGLAELRDLARGLHPAVLSDHGLEHALRALAGRAGLPVELETVLPAERLPTAVEAAAYFAVSEALTNVARYANAGEARVRVERCDGHLDVTVHDDGVGGAALGAGSGLQGLRDRLAALNGTLEIESLPGSGTRLHAQLPCDEVSALPPP